MALPQSDPKPGPQNRGATPRQLGPGDVCETSSLVTIRKEAPGGTAEFPGVAGRIFFVSADGKILVKSRNQAPCFAGEIHTLDA